MKKNKTKLIIQKDEKEIVVCALYKYSNNKITIRNMNENYRDRSGYGLDIGNLYLPEQTINVLSGNVPCLMSNMLFICGKNRHYDFRIFEITETFINFLFEKNKHYL